MYHIPHNERALTSSECWNLVHAPQAHLPAGYPVGGEFETLALFERELNGEVDVGSGMHVQVIGNENQVPVDDDQFIAKYSTGSPRNGDVAASTAAYMSVASLNDVGGETVLRAGASASEVGCDWDREGDFISRFGRLARILITFKMFHSCRIQRRENILLRKRIAIYFVNN